VDAEPFGVRVYLDWTDACLFWVSVRPNWTDACLFEVRAYLERTDACLFEVRAYLKRTDARLFGVRAYLERTDACLFEVRVYPERTDAHLSEHCRRRAPTGDRAPLTAATRKGAYLAMRRSSGTGSVRRGFGWGVSGGSGRAPPEARGCLVRQPERSPEGVNLAPRRRGGVGGCI
jgi:hypothetical protein